MRAMRSLLIRQLIAQVGVTGFPNPATKSIVFIADGERETEPGIEIPIWSFASPDRTRFPPPLDS